jgi:PKD repeat protein
VAVAVAGTPTAAGATGPVNAVTISKPAGVSDGDLLIAVLRASSSAASADFTCSGWTRAASTAFTANSSTSRVHGIYYKKIPSAAAETATSYTFTFTGTSGRVSGQIFRVTGSDPTTPIQVATSGYDATGITNGSRMPALTATAAGLLIVAGSNETTSPNSSTPTTPTGTTFIGISESTTGTAVTRSTTAAYWKAITGSGSTGTFDVVWGAQSSSNAEGVIINPASATPPTAAFTHSESNLTTSVDGTGSTPVSPATIASYDWDWGDSTPHGSGSTATHSYRDAGTFTVTLTVTDSNGLTGTVTHTATVARRPSLRLGSTELSRFRPGASDLVAIYVGSTKAKQLSHTIEEIQADTNFYVAHRGFSSTFPEMTMEAYDQAFAWGAKAIEISVWPSADGTFWCTHNQNLSAATGGVFPNNIDTYTDAQLASALVIVPVGTEVSGQTSKPLTKLADVLAKYGTRLVIFIEDKTYSHAAQLVPLITAIPGYQHRFIWKQDANGNPIGTATAAGLKTWGYLFYDEMATYFAGQQSKFDYFGLDYRCDDATCTSAIATAGGSRTIGHVIPSAAQATRMLGFGVKGLMNTGRSFTPANAVL